MKKVLIIISALISLVACDSPFEMDLPLSVAQRKISLSKEAGATHVLVYADGEWTATFTEPVEWGSLNKVSGYGNSDLVFSYSANYAITRQVSLVLAKDELRDTIVFTQAGMITTPVFEPAVKEVPLFNTAGTAVIDASSNLLYCADAIYAYALYPAADGSEETILIDGHDNDPAHWITAFSSGHDKFTFKVAANASGAERAAKLKITIANPSGSVFNKYVTVIQKDGKPAFTLPALGFGSYGPDAQNVLVETPENNIWPYRENMTVSMGTCDWISDVYPVPGGLSMMLTKNTSGQVRTQDISLTYVSDAGEVISGKFTIIQSTK